MTRKLDKEHQEEIQALRAEFTKNSSMLGNIAIELHVLNRQLEMMNAEQDKFLTQFESLRTQESELMQKMRERYGDGQINIVDGTFTPDSSLAE
jgi:predicted transcriptional regulator